MFISHDLNVIRFISDEIAVMYLGQIVETAAKNVFSATPLIPTRRLFFRRLRHSIRKTVTAALFSKAIYLR